MDWWFCDVQGKWFDLWRCSIWNSILFFFFPFSSHVKTPSFAGNQVVWMTIPTNSNMAIHLRRFYTDLNTKNVKFGSFALHSIIMVNFWLWGTRLAKYFYGISTHPIRHWYVLLHWRIQNAHRRFGRQHFHAMEIYWFAFVTMVPFGAGIALINKNISIHCQFVDLVNHVFVRLFLSYLSM